MDATKVTSCELVTHGPGASGRTLIDMPYEKASAIWLKATAPFEMPVLFGDEESGIPLAPRTMMINPAMVVAMWSLG